MKRWAEYEELRNYAAFKALIETGMSYTDIARSVGCSTGNVKTAMRVHGIQQRYVELCRVKKGKRV